MTTCCSTELHELGIANQQLVVNGLLRDAMAGDEVAAAYAAEQRRAVEVLPAPLDAMEVSVVPLVGIDMVGLAALRALVDGTAGTSLDRQTDYESGAGSGTRDPVLRSRARLERAHVAWVRDHARRVWALPWNPTL